MKNLGSKWILTGIHLLLFIAVCGQHINNWAFGLQSGITFSTNPPSIIHTAISQDTISQSITQSSTSYSNCNGDLIVYGHSNQLWNKNHKPLVNGSFNSQQSINHILSAIVPMPKSSRYLYFFYRKWKDKNSSARTYLYYSIIDMNLDNGLVGVTIKDILLDSSSGNFGAVGNNFAITPHKNKKDIWIVFATSSKTAKSYLLTDSGISNLNVLNNNIFSADHSEAVNSGPASNSIFRAETGSNTQGHFKFSHDGKNLIVSGIDSSTTNAGACLMYDFDNSTGILSNQKTLLQFSDVLPQFGNGFSGNFFYCEIAPNDTFIYFINYLKYALPPNYKQEFRSTIVQVNRFTFSKTTVRTSQFLNFCAQIGPDGKIYVLNNNSNIGSPQLACIDKPNLKGIKCEYKIILQDSNFLTKNFPYVYQPYYKLYFTSNLQTNPCADTAYFDVHVDDFFREFKVYYGDGDSLVLKPPFQKAYHLKHIYKNTGNYYFKVMGLNPNCDYYTIVGDSVSVARQPSRPSNNSSVQKECTSSILQIRDSFFNAQKVIYSFTHHNNDTILLNDSTLNTLLLKPYLKADSVHAVVLNTQVSNASCPYPSVYSDTVTLSFLPDFSSEFSLSSANSKLDSLNGKLHISGCSPLQLHFIDSSLNLRNGSVSWNNISDHYSNTDTISGTFQEGFYSAFVNDTNVYGCAYADTFYITSHHTPDNIWMSNALKQCLKGNHFELGSLYDSSDAVSSVLYWGDGDSAIMISGKLYPHSYKSGGKFLATLQSITNQNCKNSIDTSIVVYPEINAGFQINRSTQCIKGNSFLFSRIDTSYASNHWKWGDGSDTLINDLNARQSYSNNGAFTVRNITTSPNNCKDTAIRTVHVLESPVSNFTIADTVQCITNNSFDLITLTQHSLAANIAHTLRWGDADSVSFMGNKPQNHTYNQPGNYKVHLTGVVGNCADSISKWIKVIAQPNIKLHANSLCFGDSTRLQVRSNVQNLSYQWTYDSENVFLPDSTVFHVFPSVAQYPVTVKSMGHICHASDSISIGIIERPVAKFEAIHFNDHTNGVKFQFVSKSSSANTWAWDFGNSDRSSLENPEYIYNDTGYYQVKLIVSNQNTCFDTASQLIPVFNSFEFYFPNAVTPDANGINDGFGLNALQKTFVKDYQVNIFNRWGEKIFHTNDPNAVWMPDKIQQSIYIYTIQIRDIYNVLHEIKGVLEVLR